MDWRQGTNCCFVAFYLRYAHPFYATNSSAVKTEGLPHQPFQNRTIPPTFRNANIYMHLYAFTFALSLSLFVGERACSSRCIEPFHPHNLLKSTSTASPRTTSLPPLSKGGGLTARLKLLLYCVLLAICPPFLCYKLFCRQDGGIAAPSPSKTAPSLENRQHPCL